MTRCLCTLFHDDGGTAVRALDSQSEGSRVKFQVGCLAQPIISNKVNKISTTLLEFNSFPTIRSVLPMDN